MKSKKTRYCKNCCYINDENECNARQVKVRLYFSEQLFSKVYEQKLKIPDFVLTNAHCNWHQFKEK